ncbi:MULTISPECIES: sulfatase family protein [unclassified Carboxylicivirga]|uniref:sulfatase family protein n=1 Tax=Carboxylicivirga TaxID=1628153 RepID=UPI003D3489D9
MQINKIIIGLLLVACSLPVFSQAKSDKRPNIVFFIADDMTRDMFNFLPESKGRNLTPNLDKLVEEGTVMMGQHVAATVCTPSRFNVLTGTYASRANNPQVLQQLKKNDGQRVVEWNTHIMPGDANLASLMKAAGYKTGAVGKNHVYEVEDYVKIPITADASDKKVMKQQRANYKATQAAYQACGFDFAEGIYYENPDFNGPWDLAVHNLDWSTEAALGFIKDSGDEPFFLYFATTLPHGPLEAERAWNADRTITPIGKLDKAPDVLPHQSTIPKRLKAAGQEVNDRKANLLWMDDALGALVQSLKDKGVYDNTIIFFFNDHGQYAKGTVYQGATGNPSIVWKKGGFEAGSSTDALVSNVDFTPTILDLVGQKYNEKEFDGRSFASVLEGKEARERGSLYFEIGYSRGVRKGKYKYLALRYPQWVKNLTAEERQQILDDYNKKLKTRGKAPNNTDPSKPFGHVQIIPGGGDAEFPSTQRYPHYADADQLYDLEKDPNEKVNLYHHPDYQDIVKEMRAELKKHIQSIPGSFGEFKTK